MSQHPERKENPVVSMRLSEDFKRALKNEKRAREDAHRKDATFADILDDWFLEQSEPKQPRLVDPEEIKLARWILDHGNEQDRDSLRQILKGLSTALQNRKPGSGRASGKPRSQSLNASH